MPQELTDQRDKRRVNDEIDFDMISILRTISRKISNTIGFAVKAIRSNALLIIVLMVLGAALGYGAYKTTKPYYKSSMTLVLADIRNEFVEDQLKKLTLMIEDDNFVAVSKGLDITEESAKEIKKMTFYNLDQNRIAEDSVLRGSPFRIEVSLYNNELFTSLEPAITNYLENNPFFNKQKLIRQRQILSMISKYKEDITSIDSIKATVTSPRGPVNGFVYGEPIDPTNLYKESIGMYEQQVELEAELEQLDNIQVVTGFSPRLKPSGPVFLKYLLAGIGSFFILGCIVALNKEYKKSFR